MNNQIRKILALNEIGSVNGLLQKFDPKLGTNERIGKYSYLIVESDTPKPYTESHEIRIPLTNSNVDIVEFHRSFFTLEWDLWVDIHCLLNDSLHPVETSDTDSNCLAFTRQIDKFFIGFKNATDCIDSYRIQHNGVDIETTMQNRASIEYFLYNQMKGEFEKENKHGSYSLHEAVLRADESICGVYLTYAQLAEQLSVTIGFDMLLPLQGFNLYPNGIFGDLALIIKVIPNALVWACTDPKLYINDTSLTSYKTSSGNIQWICRRADNRITNNGTLDYYDRRLTQFRTDGKARSTLLLSQGLIISTPIIIRAILESILILVSLERLLLRFLNSL
jgi:hypothetical protein